LLPKVLLQQTTVSSAVMS